MTTMNFELAMAELTEIVKQLEKGELSLEDCILQYEKGIKLANSCQNLLASAQQKIEFLQAESKLSELADA